MIADQQALQSMFATAGTDYSSKYAIPQIVTI